MLKPVNSMTDDELRKLVSSEYPQFQALKERYPDTTVEEIERHERRTDFRYVATKEPRDDSTFVFPGPRVLAITLTIKPLSPMTLNVICGSGLTTNLPATVQSIKTTDCLEVGVFEPDPTGGELNGGVFLSIENDVDRNNSNVAISFVKSLGMGDCFFECPHPHTIFIYDNGTGIHQEKHDGKRVYYIFQSPAQPIAEMIDKVYSLERQPPAFKEADPDVTVIDVYCRSGFVDSSISLVVDGETEKTLCYPGMPEVIELQETIEQIQREYDDGIIDCIPESAYPVADCPVYLPSDAKWKKTEGDPTLINPETGVLESEKDVNEPIPVEVEILMDNETSIEITYTED